MTWRSNAKDELSISFFGEGHLRVEKAHEWRGPGMTSIRTEAQDSPKGEVQADASEAPLDAYHRVYKESSEDRGIRNDLTPLYWSALSGETLGNLDSTKRGRMRDTDQSGRKAWETALRKGAQY